MRPVFIALTCLFVSGSRSSAQQKLTPVTLDKAPSFVIMVGKDTATVERFSRTASELSGELRFKGRKDRFRYTVHLRPDGSASSVNVAETGRKPGTFLFSPVPGKEIPKTGGRGGNPRRSKPTVAPNGAYPSIGFSMALLEQVLRAKHPRVGESAKVALVNIRTRGVGEMTIRRLSTDSVSVLCDGCQRAGQSHELRFAVKPNGDIASGKNADQQWTIIRVDPATPR